MEHHDQKQVREKRVYSTYTSTPLFITGGSQGRTLEARANEEVIESAAYWFAPCGLLFLPQPRDSTTRNGLVPPPSITNLKICPTDLPTALSYRVIFLNRSFLLSDIKSSQDTPEV